MENGNVGLTQERLRQFAKASADYERVRHPYRAVLSVQPGGGHLPSFGGNQPKKRLPHRDR